MENYQILKEKIKKSQKILVGIGEEFSSSDFEQSDLYCQFMTNCKGTEYSWFLPFLKSYYLRKYSHASKWIQVYEKLKQLLENKDYFIVTLQTDDQIYHGNLETERITAPCGSYRKIQCSVNCTNEIESADEFTDEMVQKIIGSEFSFETLVKPKCPRCGSEQILNLYSEKNYCERGYLSSWKQYQDWLARTLNRELLILEFGVGFSLPQIIRWPFEKTAYLNQKAFLYRVHAQFPQLTAELSGRGISVKQNAVEFLMNL